ncbi:unnamed protein product, partial [Prorocentrum cordatum]
EVTRLWEILDEDRSGGISAAELRGSAPGLAEGTSDSAGAIAGASSPTTASDSTRATTAASNANHSFAEDRPCPCAAANLLSRTATSDGAGRPRTRALWAPLLT